MRVTPIRAAKREAQNEDSSDESDCLLLPHNPGEATSPSRPKGVPMLNIAAAVNAAAEGLPDEDDCSGDSDLDTSGEHSRMRRFGFVMLWRVSELSYAQAIRPVDMVGDGILQTREDGTSRKGRKEPSG